MFGVYRDLTFSPPRWMPVFVWNVFLWGFHTSRVYADIFTEVLELCNNHNQNTEIIFPFASPQYPACQIMKKDNCDTSSVNDLSDSFTFSHWRWANIYEDFILLQEHTINGADLSSAATYWVIAKIHTRTTRSRGILVAPPVSIYWSYVGIIWSCDVNIYNEDTYILGLCWYNQI